jgi:serine/threonine-protein kinase
VLVLASVGLIPLIIVPWLVQRTRDAVIDQILATHSVAARTTAARVDSWIRSLRVAARSVAENPQLLRGGRAAAGDMASALIQAEERIAAVLFVNADGAEVSGALAPEAFAGAREVLLRPAPTRTQLIEAAGLRWLRLSVPIPGEVGELRLLADLGEMEDILSTEELGKDGVVGLFSADRELLAASNVSGGDATFPPALLETASLRLTSGAKRYDDVRPVLAGAHSVVTEAPWFVATIQQATVAESAAADMRRTALLAVLTALVLTGAFSGLGYVTVIRPITELAEKQWKAAKKVRQPPVAGNEISRLKTALDTLQRQTLDREAIGRVFLSRYLVLDILGTGGMGSVFRGWDPKLERTVAIKTVHMGATATIDVAEQKKVLMREAITVAKFSHPNIVAIHDLEDMGEAAFLAMEFVDGISLERLLERTPVLRVEQAVPLMAQVARGLEAAHQAGVIHCDIKPANILLGREGAVKVTDFGIARSRVPTPGSVSGTFGTPGYLPPEALKSAEFTPAADLYSLATVLYELLTGVTPHAGKNVQETLVRTATDPVLPARQRNPAVPPNLDVLLLGLLEKDPAARKPKTAAEVAEALEALADKGGWKWSPPPAIRDDETREPDDASRATRAQVVG